MEQDGSEGVLVVAGINPPVHAVAWASRLSGRSCFLKNRPRFGVTFFPDSGFLTKNLSSFFDCGKEKSPAVKALDLCRPRLLLSL